MGGTVHANNSGVREGGINALSSSGVSWAKKWMPSIIRIRSSATTLFFCARARCLSAGLRYLRLTRLTRHDRGPVPGGNRSAASCLCTVLRRALYHYATRSPTLISDHSDKIYLRAFGTVYQDASSIMGGTKPQGGAICISSTSIQMSSVVGDGKKTSSSQFVVSRTEKNASAVLSGR